MTVRSHIFETVSGFCPYVNSEIDIEVKYTEVPILGSTRKQYKAVTPICDNLGECAEQICPIMRAHMTTEG